MNNLKRIMELNKITALELADVSGISVSNIRRLMNDPQATPYHYTAETLATFLHCTVAQILGEQAPALNDKELLIRRAVDAAEELVQALRDYTPDPLVLAITADSDTNRPDGLNFYSIHIEDLDGEEVLNKAAYIKFNEHGEPVFIKYLQDERRAK